MPNHDTIIEMAGTITLLRQIVDSKVEELEEAGKRIEYLEGELERVLAKPEEGHSH